MAKDFWFKFYTAAWLNDANLSLVSPEARAVWMDMLCWMAHQCDETGVFIVAGKVCDAEAIAGLLRGDKNSTLSCIKDLTVGGVVSIRQDGAYYSRKMVLDCAAKNARSRASKERCSANAIPNAIAISNSNFDSKSFLNNEITSFEILEERCSQLYEAYPRKVGKQKAIEAAMRALQRVDFDTLMAAIKRHAKTVRAEGQEDRFIKYMATWLNQSCWNDDTGKKKGLWDE